MSSQSLLYLVIGVAVLGLLIYRQLSARPVQGNQRVVLILLIVGLVETAQYLQKTHPGSVAIAALVGSLVLAAVFGAMRAATVRIWLQDGQIWAKGNLLTAALWIVALAAHLGYDYLIVQHKGIGVSAMPRSSFTWRSASRCSESSSVRADSGSILKQPARWDRAQSESAGPPG
jgi:hypothetical protein